MIALERIPLAQGLEPSFPAADLLGGDAAGLWWLGQSGFALRHGGRLILIDPYLSDSLAEKYRHGVFKHERLMPVPIAPELITGCEAVLCTHGHTDHMDPPTIRGLQQQNAPLFIVPRAECERALERGAPPSRLQGFNAGECLDLGAGLLVEAIPSAHEQITVDPQGNHRFLGYIITAGPFRLYHAGDCVPYEGLVERLRGWKIDLALLPVNGRDAYRSANGVPGNFTAREAVELCDAAGIPWLICHHIGMFAFNSVAPEEAAAELGRHAVSVRWLLPEVGVLYRLRAVATHA